jgi:hypothetical protein
MKKTNNILYLTDEYLYLNNKKVKNIIKYPLPKKCVINSKIASTSKFTKVFEKLIKEKNLNNYLFGDTITIIINSTYTDSDLSILKNIFEALNYKKITFINENKLYRLTKENAYLNIYNTYMILTYINEYKKTNTIIIPNNFFDSMTDTIDYINKKINSKEIFLIGNGEELQNFFSLYENKYHIPVYLYTDNEYYIMNAVAKKLKIKKPR